MPLTAHFVHARGQANIIKTEPITETRPRVSHTHRHSYTLGDVVNEEV